MPIFEYFCQSCDARFEEFLTSKTDIQKYKNKYVCECGKWANRVPSTSSPVFSGKPGKSGFHDVDYPVLDKAVGRSANKKWTAYNNIKEQRDAIRQKHGTSALTIHKNNVVPTSPAKLEIRRKALESFNKRKSQ